MENNNGKKPIFTIIGIFLIVTFAIEFPIAAMLVYYGSSESVDFGDTLTLQGTIITEDDAILSGVRVSIVGTNLSSLSDIRGNYRIPNAPTGIWRIRAATDGYKEETHKVLIHRTFTERMDFVMEEVEQEDRTNEFNDLWFFYTLAVVMMIFSSFIIAGGFYSFKRMRFSVVLVGAILGMFTMGPPVVLWAIPPISIMGASGFLLSTYALLLVVKNRKAFIESEDISQKKEIEPM